MNKLSNRPNLAIQLTRALLLISLMAMSALCVLAAEQVTIKGQLFSADNEYSNARVYVIQQSGITEYEVSENGHFHLKVAAAEKTLLRFEKLGYITKEVLVDTKNIFVSNRAKKQNRSIKFDVELMPESFGTQVAFIAPVGQIRFVNGSGLMRVEYMYMMRRVNDPNDPDGEEVIVKQ